MGVGGCRKMWPCNSKFMRTFKDDDPAKLGNCYAKIPGLSQTCKYYKQCGSRTSVSDWNKDVCQSDTGDYYKEPEVQRMCGICDMFHAELADSRETPDEFGKMKEEGGCIADSGVVWRRTGGNATNTLVRDLRVGDEVWTPSGYRRVYYIMPHKHPVHTVELWWQGGNVEASRHHLLPVLSAAHVESSASHVSCEHAQSRTLLKSADDVSTDHVILVPLRPGSPHARTNDRSDSSQHMGSQCRLARVQRRTERTTHVRYILVEGDYLVVRGSMPTGSHTAQQHGAELVQGDEGEGAVLSVYSSPLAAWETLPFRALDKLVPGCLQWVAVGRALTLALESPLLVFAESALRAVASLPSGFTFSNIDAGFVESYKMDASRHSREVMSAGVGVGVGGSS